ncbi:hypothetical protein TRFO_26442 [Tritrichomonas foetus]|uniref:FPL domain-containing protein n=1 Tax=Tritrichomonas foetus TaxID=1144522 RepID=A0A1J4K473_9EUKA|nr:hypothetical protein TRFO_26442 [Tritrichomonas foetus]|eukprot:OHT05762.1 hypothetical protein TRFO_26442 [Tritrichomonas foetus]
MENYKKPPFQNKIETRLEYLNVDDKASDHDLIQRFHKIYEAINFAFVTNDFQKLLFNISLLKDALLDKNSKSYDAANHGIFNFNIIQILFSSFEKTEVFGVNPIIINCLEAIVSTQKELINYFLCPELLHQIKHQITHQISIQNQEGQNDQSEDTLLCLLNLLNSIVFNTDKSNNSYGKLILSYFSIRTLFELSKMINQSFLLFPIFLIIKNISSFLFTPDDESALLEMVHYFFYEKTILQSQDDKLITIFTRSSLCSIYNRLFLESFDFPLFEKLNLFELLNYFLVHPPVESHALVCRIIVQLYQKYQNIDYLFNVDKILELFFEFNSARNQNAAAEALNEIIKQETVETFFKNDCFLLFKFCDVFELLNSKTKIVISRILYKLALLANLEQWKLIFTHGDQLPLNNQSIDDNEDETMGKNKKHVSLFYIFSRILEINSVEIQIEVLHLFVMMFDTSYKINMNEKCYTMFLSVFDLQEFIQMFTVEEGQVNTLLQRFINTYFPDSQ